MSDRLPEHLQILGLSRNPFPATPDAACYFQSPKLERELHEAAHCLLARKGFVLLTAEVGMGKSTFVRRLLDMLGTDGVAVALVFNTFLQGRELLAAILRDFGLAPGAGFDEDIAMLNAFLIERWRENVTCVLVIDDAQNLSLESLELLRLLSNIETGQEKLLQIVLAGQPELHASLERYEIRQLTSRIVCHIRLAPFDQAEIAHYVDFRLGGAGVDTGIALSPHAVRTLHRRSGGNPRRIHMIMDRCLYGVFAGRNGQVSQHLVERAARESGARAAPYARPRWRWAALAAVTLAVGVVPMALRLTDRAAPRLAQAPALVSTATAAPIPAAGVGSEPLPLSTDCIQRGLSRRQHVIAVPRSHAGALAQLPGLCVAERGEQVLVAWPRRLLAQDLMPGRPHASTSALQGVLAGENLYHAPIDGLFGPETRRALADYQNRHALAATGLPDELTLLLIDVAIAATPRTALEDTHADG